MEYSAFKWWNSKRIEYNLKFLACLALSQLLLLGASHSLDLTTADNILRRIIGTIVVDIFIVLFINIIYFLWPIIEIIGFKSNIERYRKICFAMINLISVLIFVGSILMIIVVKS